MTLAYCLDIIALSITCIVLYLDLKERRKLHASMVDYHKKQIALESKVDTLCHFLDK